MKVNSKVIIATVSALAILGIVGTSLAAPNGSQRLRGLGDRVFLVTATITVDREFGGALEGYTLPNCYIFDAEADPDGYNWFESAFPDDVKGTWAQDSNGAKTSYEVEATNSDEEQISQWGRVTPARGKGVLQLEAETFLDRDGDGVAELEFFSVGEEIEASEKGSKCPDTLILLPPEE